uniref:Clock-controlled protein 6 n=1 Tax=Talaromyces marneffei PM1 TaxID=1077442 RepID=A0A093V4N8_TALMA
MRFTAAAIVAFAAGALASASSSASVITEVITSYETYCPEATSFVAGSSTVHVTAPGTITLTGSYTVTRPLLSSTVTICNACSTAVPLGTGSPKPHTSIPVAPVAVASSTTAPASPAFTGGASHAAAGAGAGLAAVFGVAAFLL